MREKVGVIEVPLNLNFYRIFTFISFSLFILNNNHNFSIKIIFVEHFFLLNYNYINHSFCPTIKKDCDILLC